MDTLRQEYLFLPFSYKDCYLAYVCSEFAGSSAIIFCCTCSNAQRIAIMLRTLGFGAIPIHGKMSQSKRVASLNKFKAGQRSILVATDVASRGLDIPRQALCPRHLARVTLPRFLTAFAALILLLTSKFRAIAKTTCIAWGGRREQGAGSKCYNYSLWHC